MKPAQLGVSQLVLHLREVLALKHAQAVAKYLT